MTLVQRFRQCLRAALRYLKDQRGQGYLVEVAIGVAVNLTLAAALVPVVIAVNTDSRVTRARKDVGVIATGILNMYTDTKEFPVRAAAGERVSAPLASGERGVRFLRSGGASDDSRNPTLASGHPLGTSLAAATCAHLLNNHLVFDTETTVCAVGGAAARGALKYRESVSGKAPPANWKGPYLTAEIFQDPWGRNFIVLPKGGLVAAKQTLFTETPSLISGGGTTSLTQFYAWVLSAGSDGILQTSETDSVPSGDDIGTVFAVINTPEASAKNSQ